MEKKNLSYMNRLDTDFRGEFVASGLVDSGTAPDKLLMLRHKGDKRDISKDIDKIQYQYSGFDMMEYLYIYTNRESMYDSLPEGLFHQASGAREQRSKEDIIRDIRKQRDEEKLVRRFFQPFEMMLDRILIEAQLYEQKYDKIHFYSNLADVIREQWSILKHLSTGQALLFIKVIPVLFDVYRSLELMAGVMALILDCPVCIREGKKAGLPLAPEEKIPLHRWKLGINSVLGDTAKYEQQELEIHIGPLSLEQMKLFEKGNKNNRILTGLVNLLVPFDRHTVFRYRMLPAESSFRLSGSNHTAYLGINTTL